MKDLITSFAERHPRAVRAGVRVAVIAAIVVGLLWALPVIAAYFAVGWLEEQGAEGAAIEDLDVNLFTGVIRVTGLDASGTDGQALRVGLAEVNVDWWPLTARRIYLRSVILQNAHVDMSTGADGAFRVGPLAIGGAGAAPDDAADTGEPWGFGTEHVLITGSRVTYRDRLLDADVRVNEIRVGSQFTWQPEITAPVTVDLTVNDSPLVLGGDVTPWADAPAASGSARLDGLDVSAYQEILARAGLEAPRGSLSFDWELSATFDTSGVLHLRVGGPITLEGAAFRLAEPPAEVGGERLHWQGTVDLALLGNSGPGIELEGELELAGVDVGLEAVRAGLAALGWQGRVMIAGDQSNPEVAARGAITARGLKADRAGLPYPLIELVGLEVQEIDINLPSRVAVGRARLDGLALLETAATEDAPGAAEFFELKSASLKGFELLDGQRVNVQNVTLAEPRARLTLTGDGELQRVNEVIAAFSPAPETAPAAGPGPTAATSADVPSTDGPPLTLTIGELHVTGDDWLVFVDQSVEPSARFALTTLDLRVSGIDLSGAEPMTVTVATADPHMKLNASGTVNAFAAAFSSDLDVNVETLQLTDLSPYVPGYNIERGRLSTRSQVRIREGALDLTNDVLIEGLKLAGKTDADSGLVDEGIAQGMSMPLDVALDLLRDGNDQIRLELPITGSLNDPKFDTSDIFQTAFQAALQKAAISYVKSALQPLGTILFVGNLAAKAARPRFEPVAMPAGKAIIPERGKAYLDKIESLLTERPQLKITLCGVATGKDREALAQAALAQQADAAQAAANGAGAEGSTDQSTSTGPAQATDSAEAETPAITDDELQQLAQLRTSTVMSYIVDHGIERSRLFACRESLEGSESEPRVEIML